MVQLPPGAVAWSGVVYRSSSVQYATERDLITGEGSRLGGGRWNPRRSFPTVYMALDPETALAETLSHFRYYGLPFDQAMPRVFVALRVQLRRVLDLNRQTIRRVLGITPARLLKEDWRALQDQRKEALTQALGRAAYVAGFEGILVPSAARPEGSNLVLLLENLVAPSTAVILNADQLPKHP